MSKIAGIQMCATDNIDQNLQLATSLIAQVVDGGAKLVCLPEAFSYYGGNVAARLGVAEHFGHGRVQDFLANQAYQRGIWIIGGTVLLKFSDNKFYISSLIYDAQGQCVGVYRKMHLFEAHLSLGEHYSESSFASPGQDYLVVSTPIGRVGCSVCFDLRFPEVYQKLYQLGAEILVVPAAFTHKTGCCHWEILLRTRAIDTFCYVIAPAQYGWHSNGLRSYGHSMIVNPWGEVLQELTEDQQGVVLIDVQLSQVYQARKKIIKL